MLQSQPLSSFTLGITLVVDESHKYHIQSPSAEIGEWQMRLMSILRQIDDDTPEDDPLVQQLKDLPVPEAVKDNEYRALLGDAYDEMRADGMPYEVLKLAVATVGRWLVSDAEQAVSFWNSGGHVPKANRQARRTSSSRATAKGRPQSS